MKRFGLEVARDFRRERVEMSERDFWRWCCRMEIAEVRARMSGFEGERGRGGGGLMKLGAGWGSGSCGGCCGMEEIGGWEEVCRSCVDGGGRLGSGCV